MNYVKLSLVNGAVLGLVLGPWSAVVALAHAPTTPAAGVGLGACARFEQAAHKLEHKVGERHDRLLAKKTERMTKLTERRADRLATRTEHRVDWTERRDEIFDRLEAKADTDAKKQALATFQQVVNTAVTTRRAAIDAAANTFHQGVDGAVNARQQAAETASQVFKKAVADALAKAQTDCAATGADAAAVKETYRASVKQARETFNTARQAVEKMDLETLNTVRKAAFQKAADDFKATMDKARADLKVAFGE
ncbi:MAG: hypothetical protein AAB468_02940 [Patescibacteria group bacterium]